MTISSFPTAPVRSDSATFRPRAEAWVAHMGTFTAEANALVVEVQDNADAVAIDKGLCVTAVADAQSAQAAAESASSASVWVSGTTYAIGNVRFSPINFLSYRRKIAGAGTTDPSVDSANWASLTISGTDCQTFLSSGTWTKPSGKSATTRVLLQLWGGGGSGGRYFAAASSGGGGGAYTERWCLLSDLGSTEAVVVGSGGASRAIDGDGSIGGNSSVAGVTAYGGGPGLGGTTAKIGGGGGGPMGAANANVAGNPIFGYEGTGGGIATNNNGGAGNWHGGGGGGNAPGGGNGGNSIWGGGGGAASNYLTGGVSLNGGAGGNSGSGAAVAGTVPAGGGGGSISSTASGAGGNGKVIITVF